MRRQNAVTLTEVLLVTLGLGIGLAGLLYVVSANREESRRIRCRSNLNSLAKGMATYLNQCGDNRFYPWPVGLPGCGTLTKPSFGGAEWLANLYWTGIMPHWGIFVCPSSEDDTELGALLGTTGCPGGRRLDPHAVSYAAMGSESVGVYLKEQQNPSATYAASILAIRDDFPPNEAMASDDTEEPINHGSRDNGGMNVLFFDSHVEWWTHERVDLERGVGTGELVHLRN
ncbi:MAG TPA: H-X9-DG-CTERM domain-containing protein [Planctomycetota bacterium]|nr:H-X9-DG-CTERM domain-containing protein [Planctomycetota bacterium]